MNESLLEALGKATRTARALGLGEALRRGRDFLDVTALRLHRPPLSIRHDGLTLAGCFRHRSFLHHLATGRYEPFMAALFREHLRPGMTVVDGGAHIGLYTLAAARAVGPDGHVIAIEPDPFNHRCLVRNLAANGLTNATVIRRGVSEVTGTATFYQSSGTISSSLGNRTGTWGADRHATVQRIVIHTITLDDAVGERRVDVVKLDIEGAEILALRGMTRLLQANPGVTLFLEINPTALPSFGTTPAGFVAALRELGFEVEYVDEERGRLMPVTDADALAKGMLRCRKP